MEYKIESQPDYAFLSVKIPSGETLKVEASSMASMDSNIQMKTKMKGGLSRFLARESLFINEFTAQGGPGEITIAPGPSGDIGYTELDGSKPFYLTSSSFLACTPGVQQETKWQGMTKGFFSGESFFLLRNTGKGQLWFNCFGAIFPIDVKGRYVVDTGHVVAFTDGLGYEIGRIGGYKSLFFSGEGFVCRFRGEGRVWIQTKKPLGLVAWADAFRRVKKQN